MVDAGMDDVLIANEIVDPAKMARFAALATPRADRRRGRRRRARWQPLSRAAMRAGVTHPGARRRGHPAPPLRRRHTCRCRRAGCQAVDRHPGCELRRHHGLRGAGPPARRGSRGQDRRAPTAVLAEAAQALVDSRASNVDVVSASGTSTLREAIDDPTITEIQAGVYALMEPELLAMDLPFRVCDAIRGTVISRHPGRVVLDGGRRVFGLEYGPRSRPASKRRVASQSTTSTRSSTWPIRCPNWAASWISFLARSGQRSIFMIASGSRAGPGRRLLAHWRRGAGPGNDSADDALPDQTRIQGARDGREHHRQAHERVRSQYRPRSAGQAARGTDDARAAARPGRPGCQPRSAWRTACGTRRPRCAPTSRSTRARTSRASRSSRRDRNRLRDGLGSDRHGPRRRSRRVRHQRGCGR